MVQRTKDKVYSPVDVVIQLDAECDQRWHTSCECCADGKLVSCGQRAYVRNDTRRSSVNGIRKVSAQRTPSSGDRTVREILLGVNKFAADEQSFARAHKLHNGNVSA